MLPQAPTDIKYSSKSQILNTGRQPLTTDNQVPFQVNQSEIFRGKNDTRKSFSPSISGFLVTIFPQMLHTHLHTLEDKRRKPGDLLREVFFRKFESKGRLHPIIGREDLLGRIEV